MGGCSSSPAASIEAARGLSHKLPCEVAPTVASLSEAVDLDEEVSAQAAPAAVQVQVLEVPAQAPKEHGALDRVLAALEPGVPAPLTRIPRPCGVRRGSGSSKQAGPACSVLASPTRIPRSLAAAAIASDSNRRTAHCEALAQDNSVALP